MSEPTPPDETIREPVPDEEQTATIDLRRSAAPPASQPWVVPARPWETQTQQTLGWGSPPPQAGWTRQADGSWSPPRQPETPVVLPPAAGQGSYVPPPPGPPPTLEGTSGSAGSPKRRRRPSTVAIAVMAGLFVFGTFFGVAIGQNFWQSGKANVAQVQPSDGSGTQPSDNGNDSNGLPWDNGGSAGNGSNGSNGSGSENLGDVDSIAAAVSPALVNINVSFGYSGGQGAATGIVLTSSGLVLTNNHVIDGATKISATDVGNGKTYTATVLGYDKTRDIALIQLENASGLTTARIGDSSKVKVGQMVVAIGNAGGDGGMPDAAGGTVVALDQEVVAGDQSTGESERLNGLIQTDADIQQGDSGGPLVNASGEVIGINSVGSSGRSFDSAGGGGYAVPVNTAMEIVNQIQDKQSSDTVHIGATAFLGVQLSDNSYGQGGFGYGWPDDGSGQSTSGATVAGVLSGSPAAQAGLSEGDVIVSFDGRSIDSAETLSTLIASHQPGDQVKIVWVDQSGSQQSSTVQLAEGPAD